LSNLTPNSLKKKLLVVKEEVAIKRKDNIVPTRVYCEANKKLEDLKLVKRKLDYEIHHSMKGIIKITKSGNRIQYYFRENAKDRDGTYIPVSQTHKIKSLLQKRYNQKVLKLIEKEIKSLEEFIKKAEYIPQAIQEIYSSNPIQIKEQIIPVDISDEDYVKQWLDQKFIPKPIIENDSTQKTDRGEIVRSKSELNIANYLYKMGIPYKYECPITLINGQIIHPDFTVLDVKNRKEVYWEHRGMMDDRDYARHSVKRIRDYNSSGIFLGMNLIITEETSSIQLGTNEIERIVQAYF